MKKYIFALTALCGFTACQEVIQVDLPDNKPFLIIEGVLTDSDELGSSYVQISKNTDYYTDNKNGIGLSGASITITDNLGNRDSLFEVPANLVGGIRGFYGQFGLKSVPGRTYTLRVEAEGKTYTAVCATPTERIIIDSLTIQRQQFNNDPDSVNQLVYTHFKDKVGVVEHFKIQSSRRDAKSLLPVPNVQFLLQSNARLWPDGQYHSSPMFNLPFKKGETAIIKLWSIDAKMYDYFRTLQDATGNAFATPAAPANPNTNIKGGAQGYFAAVSEAKDTILVK